MAGVERIELPSKVLETPMLPLYHTPINLNVYIIYHIFIILATVFKEKKQYILYINNKFINYLTADFINLSSLSLFIAEPSLSGNELFLSFSSVPPLNTWGISSRDGANSNG